eukprot:2396386-Amphidinium_carterae.1
MTDADFQGKLEYLAESHLPEYEADIQMGMNRVAEEIRGPMIQARVRENRTDAEKHNIKTKAHEDAIKKGFPSFTT